MNNYIKQHLAAINDIDEESITKISQNILKVISAGGTIYTFGNGGSAADAQHFVAELVGRFEKERAPIKAICLNTNVSDLTAIANDYGYEEIFARPIEALVTEKDCVIGFSTSGNSKNIVKALQIAKSKNCYIVGFTGDKTTTNMLKYCNDVFYSPSIRTSIIQECHILAIHMIVKEIEDKFI